MMFRRKKGGLSFRTAKKLPDKSKILNIVKWAAEIAACVALSYAVVFFFGFRTIVIGEAMSGTLESSDIVLINRLAYMISEPASGQVVAFVPDSNSRSNYYIRRIVAVPGDTVLISDGYLYVNGEIVELSGSAEEITVAGIAAEEITLGDDEYFVMGDNPNASEDSRHSGIGTVSKEEMTGIVWFIVFPFESIGTVD